MKNIVVQFVTYLIVLFVLYVCLLSLALHVTSERTLYYFSIVLLLLLSLGILLLAVGLYKLGRVFDVIGFQIVVVAIISNIFLGYSFLITVPVLFDRSISIMMIGYMNNAQEKTVGRKELVDAVWKRFFIAEDSIGKRIDEQILSGFYTIQGNCLEITDRGRLIAQVNKTVAAAFAIKNDFTDPPVAKQTETGTNCTASHPLVPDSPK